MRTKTLLVLVTFALLICAPFKINVRFSPDKKNVSFFTLDICHASDAGLSIQTDILCALEYPQALRLFESTYSHIVIDSFFNLFLIPFQQEHPPKA
jgi:hypothetical protein